MTAGTMRDHAQALGEPIIRAGLRGVRFPPVSLQPSPRTDNPPGGRRATEPFWRADGTICYIATEPERSLNRFIRFIATDGSMLADPATPIRATHPRIRPGM